MYPLLVNLARVLSCLWFMFLLIFLFFDLCFLWFTISLIYFEIDLFWLNFNLFSLNLIFQQLFLYSISISKIQFCCNLGSVGFIVPFNAVKTKLSNATPTNGQLNVINSLFSHFNGRYYKIDRDREKKVLILRSTFASL